MLSTSSSTMSSLPEIERRIRADWPGTTDPIPLKIVHAFTLLKNEATADYITLPLVVQLLDQYAGFPASLHAGDRDRIATVYTWTQYLTNVGLIDAHFELLRDNGTTVLLDSDMVADALEKGELFDPDSGRAIADWICAG